MAEDKIRRLATEQKKRLIAGLLNSCEGTAWYKQLTPEQRQAYRKEVFERVGVYHDFMLDIIKVADDSTSMVNEEALNLLEQLHAGQARLERSLSAAGDG